MIEKERPPSDRLLAQKGSLDTVGDPSMASPPLGALLSVSNGVLNAIKESIYPNLAKVNINIKVTILS